MTPSSASHFGKLRLAAAAVLLIALAACATPFRANVSRFQSQLPAPAGQTFAIVADNPKLSGGLEFAQYAGLVSSRLSHLGYLPVADPKGATLIVHFDYGVDAGRERISSYGYGGPYWGGWGGWGPGFYGRGWGGWGGGWGWGPGWHYGWYDPWIESYTVYTSGISLKIDRAADGMRLFEGKAEAVSTSNHLQYLVPNLIEAMFTGFPGNSGETVRITVGPEKK